MGFKYFENRECEFYPCHGIENINCLFCFCPLYNIEDCGGNAECIKDSMGREIKDCSNCVFPHIKENYDHVIKKLEKPFC